MTKHEKFAAPAPQKSAADPNIAVQKWLRTQIAPAITHGVSAFLGRPVKLKTRKYGPRRDPPPPPFVWFRWFPSWETSPVVVPGIKPLQIPDLFQSHGWPEVAVDCGRWKGVSHTSDNENPVTSRRGTQLQPIEHDTDMLTPLACDVTGYLGWSPRREGPAVPARGAKRAARKRDRAWQRFWKEPLVFTSLKPKLSLSKLRPWEQEGISRATWYRRRGR
jgi:hypothetical protein